MQQEVLPRVSVNVGYFRNWWGNRYAVDNRATTPADYTPFSIVAPSIRGCRVAADTRSAGCMTSCRRRSAWSTSSRNRSENFARQIENWQGVDVIVSARLRNGLTVQGGTSTGRQLSGRLCAEVARARARHRPNGAPIRRLPAALSTNPYCRVVEPYLTQVRGSRRTTIPKITVQVSGTWPSNPGAELAANLTVPMRSRRPSLGRDLSCAANVSVNLVEPGTLYAERRNNLDFRVSKLLRYGRTRTQVGLDIYNLTNTDVVTGFNQTFVPNGSWLTPTSIQPAR